MNDSVFCPFCGDKFKNSYTNNNLPKAIQGNTTYIERVCASINHVVIFYTEKNTLQVDYIIFSIYPNYSVYIEVNFLHKATDIFIYNREFKKEITLPKILEPDFPQLTKIKDIINMYLTFS